MPSAFSHAIAAAGIGACFYRPGVPARVWLAGAVCSMLPDLDVVGFRFGIRYGDFWGHRGFTHSLLFAALLAGAALTLLFPNGVPNLSRVSLWAYLFLATASHGFLDAMTDGGLGVAFFAPFSNARYFFPVDSHPRFADRHEPVLWRARAGCVAKRIALRLVTHTCARYFRLAHSAGHSRAGSTLTGGPTCSKTVASKQQRFYIFICGALHFALRRKGQ